MYTAMKDPVPDQVKPSFVIFDIRALWRSWLSVRVPGCQKYKWRLNPVWHRMLYGCIRVATVSVKVLRASRHHAHALQCPDHAEQRSRTNVSWLLIMRAASPITAASIRHHVSWNEYTRDLRQFVWHGPIICRLPHPSPTPGDDTVQRWRPRCIRSA